jgi:hypothetical protein
MGHNGAVSYGSASRWWNIGVLLRECPGGEYMKKCSWKNRLMHTEFGVNRIITYLGLIALMMKRIYGQAKFWAITYSFCISSWYPKDELFCSNDIIVMGAIVILHDVVLEGRAVEVLTENNSPENTSLKNSDKELWFLTLNISVFLPTTILEGIEGVYVT